MSAKALQCFGAKYAAACIVYGKALFRPTRPSTGIALAARQAVGWSQEVVPKKVVVKGE
jgi:hypothetical protein